MSDPKYNKYKGTVRFDDDNIVDIDLQPDTENITVLLNGEEVTGGGGDLPEVDSGDNGKVLTVVEGEWAAATQTAELPAVSGADNGDVLTVVEGAWAKADPPTELPAVTGADNGNVLTVVEGSWAKAAPSGGGSAVYYIHAEYDDGSVVVTETLSDIVAAIEAGKMVIMEYEKPNVLSGYAYPDRLDISTADDEYMLFVLVTYYSDTNDVIISKITYEGSGETGVPGTWALQELHRSFNGGVS